MRDQQLLLLKDLSPKGVITMNYSSMKYYRNFRINAMHLTDEVFKRYPLIPDYFVSNYGRVYSSNGYLVVPFTNRNGYVNCRLHEVNHQIHRLVAITFIPNIGYEALDVNHKNGNKQDNYVDNLEWGTRSYNVQHAFDHGLSKSGEDHPNSTHSNDSIEHICLLLSQGQSYEDIARLIGVQYNHSFCAWISKIKNKLSWKRISDRYF